MSYACNGVWYYYRSEVGAFAKSVIWYTCYPVADGYSSEAGARNESRLSNTCNGVRYGYRSESCATLESPISYVSNGVGDGYRVKVRTIGESHVSYASYGICYSLVRYRGRNSPVACIANTSASCNFNSVWNCIACYVVIKTTFEIIGHKVACGKQHRCGQKNYFFYFEHVVCLFITI